MEDECIAALLQLTIRTLTVTQIAVNTVQSFHFRFGHCTDQRKYRMRRQAIKFCLRHAAVPIYGNKQSNKLEKNYYKK